MQLPVVQQGLIREAAMTHGVITDREGENRKLCEGKRGRPCSSQLCSGASIARLP